MKAKKWLAAANVEFEDRHIVEQKPTWRQKKDKPQTLLNAQLFASDLGESYIVAQKLEFSCTRAKAIGRNSKLKP